MLSLLCSLLTYLSGPSGDASTALFLVRTSKQLECTQCHSPRNRPPATDNYELHLSFPHVSAKHFPFKELLSHNFFAEVFLRCGNCPTEMWNDPQGLGDKRQGESFNEVTKIVHFPELLCMSLNMYENDSQGRLKRIKHSVDIPLDLDLSHRSDVKAKKGAIKYRLCSVIKHQGKSPSKGHYICYSRAPKTTDWYLCDDFECIKSDFTHATKFSSKEIPYLLFFERIYEQNKGRSEVPHDSEEFEKPAWWKDTTIGLEQQPQHVTNQPGSIVEVARSDTSNPVEDV